MPAPPNQPQLIPSTRQRLQPSNHLTADAADADIMDAGAATTEVDQTAIPTVALATIRTPTQPLTGNPLLPTLILLHHAAAPANLIHPSLCDPTQISQTITPPLPQHQLHQLRRIPTPSTPVSAVSSTLHPTSPKSLRANNSRFGWTTTPIGRFLPSTLHFARNTGLFAQGVRVAQKFPHDHAEQARILFNTWNASFSTLGTLPKTPTPSSSPSSLGAPAKSLPTEAKNTQPLLQQNHGAVFHHNGRCWVIHPHNAIVRGLAWSADATPPDT